MQRPETAVHAPEAVGVIQRVDLVNRELVVLIGGVLVTVDVPVDCPIYLYGERVKLRLLQRRDRVKVTCAARGNLLVARALKVQPEEFTA